MNKRDKKTELTELLKQYVDENNCIDISQLYINHRSAYSLLPHYFGSVNAAITENGWTKITKSQNKDSGMILRDQLAYDMITLLHEGGKANRNTFEQIAARYNVSKAAISQLYKGLQKTANSIKNDN